MDNATLFAILQEATLLFLLIGSLFALLLGVLFLLSPQQAAMFTGRYNRWLSLRRPTRPLEIPHPVDHTLYHHHRLIGLLLLLAAGYILYRFGFDYRQQEAVALIAASPWHPALVEWLLEALLWFLIPFSLLLLLLGGAMALKPSTLKGLEQHANRWLSTRKLLHPLDKPNLSLDRWSQSHPRLFGALLTLAALYSLTLLLLLLLA
ncbi:MAG: hypothetical protein OQL08_05185 [Gammaproteobacteria bacterium]|nr:hypothetical protein [Gammaproteobacteria bacterium]